MDDDPTSTNHELYLYGLPGADDDDVREDAEALGFGGSRDAPVEVGDGNAGEEGSAARSPSPAASTSSTGKGGARSCRSGVWQHFEPFYRSENGKKVRYDAKCNVCHKELSGKGNAGTSHLSWHADSCWKKACHASRVQSLLHYNLDGSIRFKWMQKGIKVANG
ncbi:hypothetical protein PVAP13_7NG109512 [Panicum virgatum]|uniref:BED-type domain-containing protein n=1 Tax=Panicum virgatum TaxID=38727 RepID=A0A8T0PTD6_PANVG|nr:hypothetical protein PVAP13_7NG109512 [Panicum virgatum]